MSSSLLPSAPGLLPKWILLVGVVSALNTLQSYLTLAYTRRVYLNRPEQVSPLAGRTFGTWTLLAAIRIYTAYDMSNPGLYDLCMWSYGIALAHFAAELLLFRTVRLGEGNVPTFVIATGSLAWMWWAR